jgi:hypothetical protein
LEFGYGWKTGRYFDSIFGMPRYNHTPSQAPGKKSQMRFMKKEAISRGGQRSAKLFGLVKVWRPSTTARKLYQAYPAHLLELLYQ